MHFNIEIGILD